MPIAALSMAETAENLAERYHIGRDEVDCYAARSQSCAAAAWRSGVFDNEVVPVTVPDRKTRTLQAWAADEHMRPDTTPEALAKLAPHFRKDGVVTAGNASGISDGAAALILADEEPRPRARTPPAGETGVLGRGGCGSHDHGHRSGARVTPGAGTRRPDLGRHGSGRGQRSVRGPIPRRGARAGARPGAHQRRWRRRRTGAPAGCQRRANHAPPPARAPPPRWAVRPGHRLRRRGARHGGNRGGTWPETWNS